LLRRFVDTYKIYQFGSSRSGGYSTSTTTVSKICEYYNYKGDYVYYWAGVRQKTPVEIEEQRRLEDIGEYSPETKETMK
jgi:hypothetical protein